MNDLFIIITNKKYALHDALVIQLGIGVIFEARGEPCASNITPIPKEMLWLRGWSRFSLSWGW